MKILILLFIVFIPHLSFAQSQEEPIYYLNNERFSVDSVFLYMKNVQSLNVKKGKAGGEIYMTTKTQPWEYCRLTDLLRKPTTAYTGIFDKSVYPKIIFDKSVIPVFIIDGKVISKESDAKIDKSYYARVALYRLSNVKGLSGKSKRIVIVNVSLTDQEPKFDKDIRLRGSIPNIDN